MALDSADLNIDFNIVALCGRLAAEPEHRTSEAGTSSLRLLVTVRSSIPSPRIDLIPVVIPDAHLVDGPLRVGVRVWASGVIQRHFWEGVGSGELRSRLEVLAQAVEVRDSEEAAGPV